MSNPLRKCEPGLSYHTMSRCDELKNLMSDDWVKELVIDVLVKTQEKYDFHCYAYGILDNHFHFLIETVEGGANISRIMQYIKARIAEGYNRTMNRTGSFWNERFKDVIVEEQENPFLYVLWLLWYIAFNPVKAGKCTDPRDYKYSSILHYLVDSVNFKVKIVHHRYFLELGCNFAERVKRFLLYEEAYRKRYALLFQYRFLLNKWEDRNKTIHRFLMPSSYIFPTSMVLIFKKNIMFCNSHDINYLFLKVLQIQPDRLCTFYDS